jgi:hypothetical protein
MYLYAEKRFSTQDDRRTVDGILSAAGLPNTTPIEFSSIRVKVQIAYWRKANAIHNWFVRTIGNGVDDCEEIDVSTAALQHLYDLCKKQSRNPTKPLPGDPLAPTAGFFFGSTERDDGYVSDLADTVRQIEGILDNPDLADANFTYRASW